MDEQDNIEQKGEVKSNAKPKKKGELGWKSLLSGSILQSNYLYKQRWYILLLFILSIVYISNRYKADKTFRRGVQLEHELADKKAEYVTKSSELMRLSKYSQVIKQVKDRNIDLEESAKPPKRIKADD